MLNVVVSSVLAPKPLLHLSGREVLLSFVRAFSLEQKKLERKVEKIERQHLLELKGEG